MEPSLEASVDHVHAMLESIFPGLVDRVPAVPAFEVRLAVFNGSTRTIVSLSPFGAGEFLVRTNAWVLTDVEHSPELYSDLLRRNARSDIGAYYISEDGHVGFAHTILGSSLDPSELRASVVGVTAVADRDDDALQMRFGGYRAIDLPPTQ